MRISNLLPLSLFLLSSYLLDSVLAHSQPARPIKRLTHVVTQSLEITPRHRSVHDKRSAPPSREPILLHSDSFRLTVSAFEQTFHLHLRPNDHLVHPTARINYYHTTSEGKSVISHSEPLLRESVRAYWGEVVPGDSTIPRLREDAAGVLPGSSRHPHLGWARIMVHHQGSSAEGLAPIFEGAFSVNGVVHHVMTKENYLRNKNPLDPDVAEPLHYKDSHLVIWRDSDVMTPNEEYIANLGNPGQSTPKAQSCGHDNLPYNTDPTLNSVLQKPLVAGISWYDPFAALRSPFSKRDDVAGGGNGYNFVDTIGSTASCPNSQKVVYMGVASDCMYTAKSGSQANATQQILKNWNSASVLFKNTFNVSLGIIELQVHSEVCPSPVDRSTPWNVDCSSVSLNERLSLFSDWRGKKGNDGAGLWHLMSGCPTGTEVGIAWLATLCVQISGGTAPQIVSGTAVSTAGRTEWQVIAHEIGHNFGAIHDCTDGCNGTTACCPLSTSTCDANSKFIMSPIAEAGETAFSPCSIGNVCSLMQGVSGQKTNTTCLVDPNPNIQTISLQMCGNGIVEKGEDCDPGKGVASKCCDPATCKFRQDARCDPMSSPCCTDECTFSPPTRVCRPSRDSLCDTAEMCTGNSSACPADIFSPNGKSCGSNGLACASGQCTSVSKQCQAVGSSMNLQKACPSRNDDTCQISCQDPNRANTCIVLQSILIDGSPCGYGGTCFNGNCKPGSILDKAKAWYVQNLQISIPVTIVAGLLVLSLLWAFIMALRRCYNRVPKNKPVRQSTLGNQRLTSWDQAAMAQAYGGLGNQPRAHGQNRNQLPTGSSVRPAAPHSNWVDPTLYNGPQRNY